MRIANSHLGYCLNIYPGETAGDIFNHITYQCPRVKSIVRSDDTMGIGLWLPARAVKDFKQRPDELKKRLADQGLYVFTVNAFPFGDFHTRPVKESVYQPDWSTKDRLAYTIDVARILAQVVPEGVDGSISTVPVAYGKSCPSGAMENIMVAAATLEKIEFDTGRWIRLALEPEPDCYLEGVDECIGFFDRLRALDHALVDRYLGICVDVCHAVLQFEDPVQTLKKLKTAGIQVPKIQISAALAVDHPTNKDLEYLARFDDGIYLHQTRILKNDGAITNYNDLDEALAAPSNGLWRIHFHVPLYFEAPGFGLISTSALLDSAFFKEAVKTSTHFEAETYTYEVLPNKYQDTNASVAEELLFIETNLHSALSLDD